MNDVRLGDLDALEHKLVTKTRYMRKDQVVDVAYMVNKAPTIDAVPVVRCMDCKYSFRFTDQDGNKFLLCCGKIGSKELKDTDFCSYGKRKDGDTNG